MNTPTLYSFRALARTLHISRTTLEYLLMRYRIEPTIRHTKQRYFSEGKLSQLLDILQNK